MRAVVTGMIATFPVGGVAWDYGQYALGLEQLGFEVFYLEDTELPTYSLNPTSGEWEDDCRDGVRFLQDSLDLLSPSLGNRWHYRAADGRAYGVPASTMAEVIADADLLVNVSGGCLLREEYRRCPRKVFIDTDPGWNHFVVLPRWDSRPEAEQAQGFRGHDHFFTYARRLGKADCPLTDFGLHWRPTLPPVCRECWQEEPPGESWTTVMMWNNYQKPVLHDGVAYGSKEMEFDKIERVPTRAHGPFELAVHSPLAELPRERWQKLHWSVVDGREASATAAAYRSYVQASRGEISVAKNIYVAIRCGWFSCRSVCYLAAGRPVVVQDTGFSEFLPTGQGVVAFSDEDQAVRGIRAVEADYRTHQSAAREIARDFFDARRVLGDMLGGIGIG